MRRLVAIGLALGAIAAGFVWGFLSHRNGTFPYELLRGFLRGYRRADTAHIQGAAIARRQQLASLPYIDASFDPESDQRGVVQHDVAAHDGLNFYYRARAPEARVIDMKGRVLHRWSAPTQAWEHAEPLPNGELIVVIKNQQILKLDRDSRLVWSRRLRVHHSVDVQPNGDIYAITRRARLIPDIHASKEIVDDFIAIFSAAGELREEISILDILRDSPYAMLLPRVELERFGSEQDRPELDLLHANHIEVMDGRLADRAPLYAKGNVVLSLRNISTIVVVDPNAESIVWAWGPSNIVRPHSPVLLDTGHILIFNNGVEESEALELEPLEQRIVWRFAPGASFFSATRGLSQRLANGNTLITESERGYAHEVDPAGEVVWRFANPDVDSAGRREVLWSMRRFAPSELPFLQGR